MRLVCPDAKAAAAEESRDALRARSIAALTVRDVTDSACVDAVADEVMGRCAQIGILMNKTARAQ